MLAVGDMGPVPRLCRFRSGTSGSNPLSSSGESIANSASVRVLLVVSRVGETPMLDANRAVPGEDGHWWRRWLGQDAKLVLPILGGVSRGPSRGSNEFTRTGSRGGLNWYRNIDRNWELLAPFATDYRSACRLQHELRHISNMTVHSGKLDDRIAIACDISVMRSLWRIGKDLVAAAMAMALMDGSGSVVYGGAALGQSFLLPAVMRDLPDPLYGVTVDDISDVANIVNSSTHLSHMPTTRIVFDYGRSASSYSSAVNSIQPVSYIMGELVDSSDMVRYTLQQYHDRAAQYLSALGNKIDIWEVGNEVNGNWTGNYSDVGAKIYDAWRQVHAARKRGALTLWYDAGCGNGPYELDPIAFTNQYVPTDMRNGIDYVLVSYYETQCNNARPSVATLTTFFTELHRLYPNAKLGFGEIGFPHPVTSSKLEAAQSMINYYYGLNILMPGYIGGYFWWHYYEDMLPYPTKPLWHTMSAAFVSMPLPRGQ